MGSATHAMCILRQNTMRMRKKEATFARRHVVLVLFHHVAMRARAAHEKNAIWTNRILYMKAKQFVFK